MTALLSDPGLLLLTLFIVMLVLRVPIAISLGLSAAVVAWKFDMGIDMLPYNFFAGVAKVPLLAIPFFILAGFIMESAGIAARIVRLVENLVGDMTGGLAIATVAVATFWGAVSGSGPATVAALGLILIPAMVKNGYDKAFAAANVSVTSGLAIVIPPSIAFIVYGGIADASVPALFAAGIIPGLIVAGFLMITVYLISKKRGYRGLPRQESTWVVFKDAFWGVLTPVVILGGIYGGIFTPTEAAAVAIFYGLFVGVFVYKTFNSLSVLTHVLVESTKATSVIMFVVTCAGLFAWVASTVGLVERGAAVLLALSENPWVLLLINIILFAAGMIMDAISIYYVLLPFLLPIVHHFGWNPVWFGVMMTVNLAVGQVTPPVAVNLYVGAQIADLTMEDITPPVIPLLIATIFALAVIVLFPPLTTFLPNLFGL
ncbi:TRAP transporter large permease [uncultured Parasutterella sp.]|uniref:TRAP transporter large permease n=1 Tax=uncultured Parasutterella sp. TaxID=1263098 RepID=UPI00272B0E9D|nr:TRAP transporter large permease subunit [uncultured Parasutterella sp.]